MTIRLTGSLGLVVAFLWLSFEHLFAGGASVLIAADNSELLLPGLLSPYSGAGNALWNNFAAAGVDRMANGYFALVDIFLFRHLPGWLAHGLRIASQYGFALLGVYWLCRRTFAFGAGASLFAAFAYAAGLFPYLLHSVHAYLPMLLLSLSLVLDNKKDIARWALLGGFAFLIAHASYFSRLVPVTGAMVFLWFVFVDRRKAAWDWGIILAVCLSGIALRIGDILAIMAVSPHSHLGYVRHQTAFLTILERTVWPTVFFGSAKSAALSLLFFIGLAGRAGGDGRMKGVLLLILFSGFIMLPVIVGAQVLLIPYLSFLQGYRFEYLGFIPGAVLAFASGYGVQLLIDRLHQPRSSSLKAWGAGGAIAVAFAVVFTGTVKTKYAGLLSWVNHGSYIRNYESPVLRDLAARLKKSPWPERAELFQLFPAYPHAYGIETAGGYVPIYYRRYYEFWDALTAPRNAALRPGTQDYNEFTRRRRELGGTQLFRGDRLMLMPEDYRSEWRLGDLYRLNLLSLANVGYLVSRDRLVDPSLTPVSGPAQPWSSLDTRGKAAVNLKANFRGREHLYIYRNENVLPRFFTVETLRALATGAQVLDEMAAAAPGTLRATAFVEAGSLPDGVSPERRYAAGDISLENYAGDSITLTVKAEDAAVLIVTNSYSPFWKADVNGVATPIFPAYHAFWGIALPGGTSTVTFRFDPPYR